MNPLSLYWSYVDQETLEVIHETSSQKTEFPNPDIQLKTVREENIEDGEGTTGYPGLEFEYC